MKKLICIVCFLSLCIGSYAQGIRFTEGTWQEILNQASKQNCPIFIDVYTSWCGPCKKMAKEIFTQPEAGEYFNTHFINYKIDAEKGEGIQIARRFNVTAYPTCLFVTGEGKLVSSFMGAQSVPQLIKEGEKAVKNFSLLPQITRMDSEYEGGRRDTSFLRTYCRTRKEFGERGGQPVNDLLGNVSDREVLAAENIALIQEMTVYDASLVQRFVTILKNVDPTDKKAGQKLNSAIMKALSTFINQCLENNDKTVFEQLMDVKQELIAIYPSNEDNGLSASMGGGMSYIAPEQLKLTFYMKNKYPEEFSCVFLDYLQRKMEENPTDSLIARSDAVEKYYADYLQSDTVSEEKKKEMKQGRGFMQLISGIQNKLLSASLYNAAEYYWKIHAPQSEALKEQYIAWLKFFYALDRTANIGIPVSEKLVELGRKDLAKDVLENLKDFLTLKGDPDKETGKVQEALDKIK